MLQKKLLISSWSCGLSAEQIALLQDCLGEEHQLDFCDIHAAPNTALPEDAEPCILWLSPEIAKEIRALPVHARHFFDQIPKAVLLDAGCSLADLESFCELSGVEIIRPPYARERIAEVMRRALETQSVHRDINCMAREILLERELLERKNELLTFLVNFLTHTTESLDLQDILQTAYTGLGKLLPVRSINAALWEQEGDNPHTISLFVCAPENSGVHESWREVLLHQIRHAIGNDFSVSEIRRLSLHDQPEEWALDAPEDGVLLYLPIIHGMEQLGVLVLLAGMERHLGRDQAMALDSAMRHLALSIKNARRFLRMQWDADYDALTKVHSRRHFEQRFEETLQHILRYRNQLSVIMLDIDHFKQVNDSKGHHVGDIVLREVAAMIGGSIRSTDYCARYGGEEFVILMPNTGSKKAMYLAERIRKNIAEHTFMVDGGDPLSLTVSLGLASINLDGHIMNMDTLLKDADAALYAAKASGRNCTRTSPARNGASDRPKATG